MEERRVPKKPFATARWVPALLDESLGVDRKLLDEAVARRLVVPAKRWLATINAARRKQGRREISAKRAEKIYFVMVRYPGASRYQQERDLARRTDETWGRSDFFNAPTKAFLLKGLGNAPSMVKESGSMPNGEDGTGKDSRYYSPLGDEGPKFHSKHGIEQAFRGGMSRQAVATVVKTTNLLREEYRKALKEKDPAAVAAKEWGIGDLPIPRHVAAFKPLEIPGWSGGGKRLRMKPLNVDANYRRNWRVWLYTAPHAHRYQEVDGENPMAFDKGPTGRWRTHNILIRYGFSPGEHGMPLLWGGRQVDGVSAVKYMMQRQAVASALLVHLLNHRLGLSANYRKLTVFGMHNTGPGTFYDFDIIGHRTRSTYKYDLKHGRATTTYTPVFAKVAAREAYSDYLTLAAKIEWLPKENRPDQIAGKLFDKLVKEGRDYAKKRKLGGWK